MHRLTMISHSSTFFILLDVCFGIKSLVALHPQPKLKNPAQQFTRSTEPGFASVCEGIGGFRFVNGALFLNGHMTRYVRVDDTCFWKSDGHTYRKYRKNHLERNVHFHY